MRVLFAAALLPAIILLRYVYNKDKIEKEPKGMIVKLFIFGGLTIISAAIIELVGEAVLGKFFDSGTTPFLIVSNFLIVAGAEEGGKYFILKRQTWNSPEFNYSYDAVVYSVSVSLGFAAFENVLYVLSGGISVALMRAFLSIPGHAVFSVYMGYYYGLAKKASVNGRVSAEETNLSMAFISAAFLHGAYDFCLMMERGIFMVIFFVFFISVVVLAAKKINKLSREDAPLREMPYYEEYRGY